jgi:hypothetical protein
MSPARFVGVFEALQGSSRAQRAQMAAAISALLAYRGIGYADPCSVVKTVFIHALQGHDCSVPEAKNTLPLQRGGPQTQRRTEI